MMVTQLPMNRSAPALALAMRKMPREICPAPGVAVLQSDTGVGNIMELLRIPTPPGDKNSLFSFTQTFETSLSPTPANKKYKRKQIGPTKKGTGANKVTKCF